MTDATRISAGVGGTLALEFANTAGWHLASAPTEGFGAWADVVRWAVEQQVVDAGQAERFSRARVGIGPALALREAIFRTGVAARGEEPVQADLDTIVARAVAAPPLAAWSNGRLSWRWRADHVLPQLLGVVARDAVALFAGDRARKLRLCAGGECGWLFLDESRGKPRRWCSMGDCGNRAKARRAYSRRKGRTTEPPLPPTRERAD